MSQVGWSAPRYDVGESDLNTEAAAAEACHDPCDCNDCINGARELAEITSLRDSVARLKTALATACVIAEDALYTMRREGLATAGDEARIRELSAEAAA